MKRHAIPLFLGIYFLFLCASLWAQADRGTITGTVTDPTGAVIAGASVSATNSATGIATKTLTSRDGDFTILLLPTGTYRLTAEHQGFKKYLREGIFVEGGQTTHVDVSMELGELTRTLEVREYASQIRPDTSDLGTMITTQQLTDLAMLGQAEQRDPAFFMILVPGVTGRGRAWGQAGASFDSRMLSTTVNGSQSGSTEFHLDGSIIANPGEFSADYRNWGFPVDAVGDYKLNAHTAPAEFGRSGGGIATFTLKSGTNRWHGSVYQYLRNDALDARGFFAKEVPFNRQNEFGATVGGPIRKDKTFVFAWYSGFCVRKTPWRFITSVPTTEFKMGNLSAYLGPQLSACGPDPATPQPCFDALGRPVYGGAVYDPETTRTVATGAVDLATGLFNNSGSNAVLRDAFGATAANGWMPDNIIPSSRFDTVAANILPLFPNPTRPGLMNNYESQVIKVTDIDQWGTRVDHAFSDRNRINSSFLWSRMDVAGGSRFPGPLGASSPSIQPIRVFRLSQDLILQPNLANHTTLGFNRQRNAVNPSADMFGWPAKIGLTGVNEGGPFPGVYISGIDSFGGGGIGGETANSYDLNESLTEGVPRIVGGERRSDSFYATS